MNTKLRNQLAKRKRRLQRRLSVEHGQWQSPMIRPANTKLELAQRGHAVSCGGIAAIMQLIKTIDLRKSLNEAASVFKMHLPYDEADHILNIALNLLAGGTCLDHLQHRRNDEAYLDALFAVQTSDKAVWSLRASDIYQGDETEPPQSDRECFSGRKSLDNRVQKNYPHR